ncbi:PPOX class F420-dependent oxidoreductase [Gordonia sp. VNK21]|uniref:PPOX class F420-dependent oxidoreductase n=1 Tax=Gordonia sp. VNK21 TaxID=3382483 RepID=UPI0038D3613E
MSDYDPRDLIASAKIGVLATLKASGLPQLSPVTAVYDRDADVIYISMTADRAKTKNLRRDPRAAIEYTGDDKYTWATAEGEVVLHGPSDDPDSPAVDALVEYYRLGAGEHPDWTEYRQVMVDDQRVLAALHVRHVYGKKLR